MAKVTRHHARMLLKLDEETVPDGDRGIGTAVLADALDFNRRQVWRALRYLAVRGLVEAHRESTATRNGYRITARGRDAAAALRSGQQPAKRRADPANNPLVLLSPVERAGYDAFKKAGYRRAESLAKIGRSDVLETSATLKAAKRQGGA